MHLVMFYIIIEAVYKCYHSAIFEKSIVTYVSSDLTCKRRMNTRVIIETFFFSCMTCCASTGGVHVGRCVCQKMVSGLGEEVV